MKTNLCLVLEKYQGKKLIKKIIFLYWLNYKKYQIKKIKYN